jgi:hypothetical protein
MVISAFVDTRALFYWRFHCEKLLKPFVQLTCVVKNFSHHQIIIMQPTITSLSGHLAQEELSSLLVNCPKLQHLAQLPPEICEVLCDLASALRMGGFDAIQASVKLEKLSQMNHQEILKAFNIYQQRMDKQKETQSAWDALISLNKRHYILTGFYALGDAYLISGKDPKYKNIIVLVEHREKSQINHWDRTVSKSECSQQPTIETNGDDGKGNLKRKAPSLKVYS